MLPEGRQRGVRGDVNSEDLVCSPPPGSGARVSPGTFNLLVQTKPQQLTVTAKLTQAVQAHCLLPLPGEKQVKMEAQISL